MKNIEKMILSPNYSQNHYKSEIDVLVHEVILLNCINVTPIQLHPNAHWHASIGNGN